MMALSREALRIMILVCCLLVLSAAIPIHRTSILSTNVTQPSTPSTPFDGIYIILGIPAFIIALLELAGRLEWKAKHGKSRTPIVVR